jgi:hypothetical protein
MGRCPGTRTSVMLDDDRPVNDVEEDDEDERPQSIPPDVPEADALEQSQPVPLDDDDAQDRAG